jgi:hypothetical protein
VCEIVEKAREYIDTPFHHQNRVKGYGVDCVGLVVCVFDELNIPCEDRRIYSRTQKRSIDGTTIEKILAKYCDEVKDFRPGDIGYCELMGELPHVYFVADNPVAAEFSMIHAYNSVGRVVEVELNDKWMKRTKSFWRVK